MATPERTTPADLPPSERPESMADGASVYSGATVDSAEVDTPDDSPYSSLEVITTDLDAIDFGSMYQDNHETPRARQGQFTEITPTSFVASPAKPKSLAKVVGKAKGFVKALIHRKPMRKILNKEPTVFIPESASAMAMSSAVPGGWHEIQETALNRTTLAVFIRSETMHDNDNTMILSRRVPSSDSTEGIYTPEYPSSPAPSLMSIFRARLVEADNLAALDETNAHALPEAAAANDEAPKMLPTLARIALFVPWCVAVGGAILLFPTHLERVVFASGYFPVPSPRGLRRFAFWAESADEHVMIFLMALVSLCCVDFRAGMLAATAVFCRFVLAWGSFQPRTCCLDTRLGENDMESLWLLAQGQEAVEKVLTRRGELACADALHAEAALQSN